MKKMIFLLVSAVVLLLGSAAPSPTHKPEGHRNLKSIIDLVDKYNTSLVEANKHLEFVDDVSLLVDAGCENKFFCKVHDIFGKRKIAKEEKIMNNLKKFIDSTKANCSVLLKDEASADSSRTIAQLLDHLVKCIRKRNLA